jgi:hypothetical protein
MVVIHEQFIRAPRAFGWIDLAVIGLLAAFIYALVTVAHEWSGPLQQVPVIHLEARYLPQYALFSLSRGVMAVRLRRRRRSGVKVPVRSRSTDL